MAASGLNPTKEFKPDDPVIIRWTHLSVLVDFALELKKALQGINEQSFNHFVLKMGINHGPITAGVIGARKPHYGYFISAVLIEEYLYLFIFIYRYMGKYSQCSIENGKHWQSWCNTSNSRNM